MLTSGTVYSRAAILGAVTGMRSLLPFTLLSVAARRRDTPAPFAARAGGPLGLLRSRGALLGWGLAAAGELVGDKLPMTPSRLRVGPLGGRLALGALVGAAVCRDAGRPAPLGAALGGVAAGAGAAAGYYGRAVLGRATGLPDPLWGVVEDALALGLGLAALRHSLFAARR